MVKKAMGVLVAVSGLMMAGPPLQAHHSLAGVYDMKAEK